jgi:DTW domain-containing protein
VRSLCAGCERPPIVCVCASLVTVRPRTRVVVLQHPCEAGNPIGTAWMVERCLSAQRIVGIELENDREFINALSNPDAPPILLAPGPDALDLRSHAPSGPVTLIVVDGTWPQARKLLRVNPRLAALPRYAFVPAQPSRYRIRREPAAHCVSTIEATVAALECLEPIDSARVLAPFDAMVEHQLRIAAEKKHSRHLLSAIARSVLKPKRERRPPLEDKNLVVAYGEANAWPRGSEHGPHPELVHIVAERIATGDRFEAYVAPARPLSPGFTFHTEIPGERVLAGETRDSFRARLAAFLRPDDRLAVWGFYSLRLLKQDLELPPAVDLRATATRHLGRRAGDAAAMAAALGIPIETPWALYRTGARHAAAKAVARALSRTLTPPT